MCKTYNTIGSLTTLKSHLDENKICDFKSLREVIDFQKSYSIIRQELIVHHENLIEQEKDTLNIVLPSLNAAIETKRQQEVQLLTNEIEKLKHQLNISRSNNSTNLFKRITSGLSHWNYNRKIKLKEDGFETDVKKSIRLLENDFQIKSNRHQFLTSNFNDVVSQSSLPSLSELKRKKTIIDGLNNYIYGALGEQKVVKKLETMSDDYFLINDFAVSFSHAIYNRQENDYIKSVQIDHILVGPSGVFIIETKNWSEKSIENLSLRSPVAQIKRSSFVLFYLLNNEMSNFHLGLDNHHWGEKKIPIKNLIVLTNTKPKEEFQYVKILNINELLGYVNYFKPIFSPTETKRIAETILRIIKCNKQ